MLDTLGLPAPGFTAWATSLIEFFGGLAIILGAFVALVSIPLIGVMLGAMFTVHLPNGFSSIKLKDVTAAGAQFGPPGYEVNLLYITGLLALILGGAGALSIDRLRAHRKAKILTPNVGAPSRPWVAARARSEARVSQPQHVDAGQRPLGLAQHGRGGPADQGAERLGE